MKKVKSRCNKIISCIIALCMIISICSMPLLSYADTQEELDTQTPASSSINTETGDGDTAAGDEIPVIEGEEEIADEPAADPDDNLSTGDEILAIEGEEEIADEPAADPDDWKLQTELYWLEGSEKLTELSYTSNTSYTSDTIKYVFTLSTQKETTYLADEIETRIPYYIILRDNSYLAPTDIGIPHQDTVTSTSTNDFYYYVDTNDTTDKSDDELVIKNNATIASGTNKTIEVMYTVAPYTYYDCLISAFTATTVATDTTTDNITLELESNTITYYINNGATIYEGSATRMYMGEMYYWSIPGSSTAPEGFDIEAYNYVLYNNQENVARNQPTTYTCTN